MTLEQLIYFSTVYQTRSMTKAAERLFITQSTISTAIHRLEEEFDLILFKRTKKGVVPTPHADSIYAHTKNVLHEISAIKNYVTSHGENANYTLRLDAVTSFEQIFLPEFIADISKNLPNLRITLRESNTSISVNNLMNGTSDMAIISYIDREDQPLHENLAQKNITMEFLYECTMSYYVRADHPLLNYKRLQDKTLAQYTLVTCDRLMQDEKRKAVFKNILFENNIRRIKQMLAKNDFIAILPDFFPKKDVYISTHQIVRLEQITTDAYTHFGLIYRSQNKLLPIEQDFITLLKKALAAES